MKKTETKYRTRNWKEYSTALINRGRVTLWIKVHIGIDARSGQIVAAVVTDSKGGDPDHFPEILDAVEGEIDKVGADGADDSVDNFKRIVDRGAQAIIPVRITGVIRPEPEASARNAVLTRMEELWDDDTGDTRWKVESGYHVSCRDERSQTTEVLLGCRMQKDVLKEKLKQLRASVKSELAGTAFVGELGRQPHKLAPEPTFPFDDMQDLWTRINALTPPTFTPPLTLAEDYTLPDFQADLAAMRTRFQETREKNATLTEHRQSVHVAANKVWERIKQYRKGCVAKLPTGHTLLSSVL